MRNPKQLFPLFSYFRERKKREREKGKEIGRGVDSIKASSRSRCQSIAISDSSVYLPEWWKGRIKTIKASQHYVQQNLNVVFRRSRSSEIGRTIRDRFVRCCALFFMFHYIRPYTVIVLALSSTVSFINSKESSRSRLTFIHVPK